MALLQPKWEILVEQNGHDAWRTTGGRWLRRARHRPAQPGFGQVSESIPWHPCLQTRQLPEGRESQPMVAAVRTTRPDISISHQARQ